MGWYGGIRVYEEDEEFKINYGIYLISLCLVFLGVVDLDLES